MMARMSDAKAQVEKARVALRRAVAGAMVRKEQAEAALSELQPQLEGRIADRAVAEAAGDEALVGNIEGLVDDLRAQVELHTEALTTADHDIASLKEELQNMDGLEREAERVGFVTAARDAAEPPSVEQATLSRVRDAINALEAEVGLNDELDASGRLDRKIKEVTAEAEAKAKLAELKAQHARRKSGDEEDSGEDAESAPKKPKRTL